MHAQDIRLRQRSDCPIASALDILGDKWTLLILRYLLMDGKTLYGEFLKSGEGIATNILANRLERMEACGLITRSPYQAAPARYQYRVTRMGADLLPVLAEIIRWSNRHIPGTNRPPNGFIEELAKQWAGTRLRE